MIRILLPLAAILFFLLLILPSPACRKARRAPWNVFFCHRGAFRQAGVPENTLPAFRKAVSLGQGIEWDVRFTGDGKLCVCHDDDLLRLTGEKKCLHQIPLREAQKLSLQGTGEHIPSLREALDAVNGAAPLLIEMKFLPGNPLYRKLPEELWRQMRDYPGPWMVESFDPRMLFWFRIHAPGVLRGQLAQLPEKKDLLQILASRLLLNWISRPHFIAYSKEAYPFPLGLVRFLGAPVFAWTVKGSGEWEKLSAKADSMIYESEDPRQDDLPDEDKGVMNHE